MMPWKIVKHDGEPPKEGGPWCVHKEHDDGSTGEAVACHDSEEKAKAHQAALYANVPEAERAAGSQTRPEPHRETQPEPRVGRAVGITKAPQAGARDGVERRDFLALDVELRVDGESGAPTVEGYAAVFDSPSEVLFEWDNGRFREKVARGAFLKTIREQNIPLLVEHANLPLATTGSGTLLLAEDEWGLRFFSMLEPSDPDVQRLVPKMRRGDMNKTSFGFIPIRDSWDAKAKPRVRTLHEVRLVDVSIVARPAYPATSAKVRAELMDAGMDPELVTELLVRLRRGLPLDDDDTAMMQTLTNTFRAYLPQPPAITAPLPQEHPVEQERSRAPDNIVHPLAWYRERLERADMRQ